LSLINRFSAMRDLPMPGSPEQYDPTFTELGLIPTAQQ